MDSLTIQVHWKNHTHLICECEYGIAQEISEYFSFFAKNYRFMPAYKNHQWDGKIKLFNASQRLLPVGLLKKLVRYCKENDLDIVIDDEVKLNLKTEKNDMSFIDNLNLPFTPYDHQLSSIEHMVNEGRGIILSPTSSGKSLSMYAKVRYTTEKDEKTLIIVPTVQLVKQLYSDFEDYGWDSNENVHQIYSGQDKESDKPVYISTWQSLSRQPESYFAKFENVIVDECVSENTKILTPNGNILIKDLKIGDRVINLDEKNKNYKTDKILKIHKNLKKSKSETMYKLTFDNDNTIEVTGNHEFLTNEGWIRADKLENQEIINIGTYCKDEMYFMKLIKKEIIDNPQFTYNLHIENDHNYIANDVVLKNCHLASATVIKSIMEKCTKTSSKIGLTGTLDDSKANKMTLIALFGEVFKAITTKELMNQGLVADLKIKCIQLNYPEEVSKVVSKLQYVDEVKFLKSYQPRTDFICNLANITNNNTLILFQHKDHGKLIYEQLKEKKKNVFYIDGDVDVDLRVKYTNKFEESEKIKIHFNSKFILSNKLDDVLLSCGKIKKAKDITTEDDIDNDWIKTQLSK